MSKEEKRNIEKVIRRKLKKERKKKGDINKHQINERAY